MFSSFEGDALMHCGAQRLNTPEAFRILVKKSLYALFRRQAPFSQALFFPSTGQGALKAAALKQAVMGICSGFNAPCPVPSLDLSDQCDKGRDGGALFAPASTCIACTAVALSRFERVAQHSTKL